GRVVGVGVDEGVGWSGVLGRQLVDEGVGHAVGVAGHQVRGLGGEADEVPVGAERGAGGEVVCLRAAAVNAHALGNTRLAVVDEDVGDAVGVAGNQVVCVRREADPGAVATQRQLERGVVCLVPPAVHVDPLGRV